MEKRDSMKKIAALVVAVALISGVLAQTRRIAHRSHSSSGNYCSRDERSSYGIPIYTAGNVHMLSLSLVVIPPTPTLYPEVKVSWIPDTINGQPTWRLDTFYRFDTVVKKSATYQNYVIHDPGELGHVASKSTSR